MRFSAPGGKGWRDSTRRCGAPRMRDGCNWTRRAWSWPRRPHPNKKVSCDVSNQWMLATVASLDHQSREMISGIAATAEEKLREACAQVFAGVGESLRERLKEMAQGFTPPTEAPTRTKSANTGS